MLMRPFILICLICCCPIAQAEVLGVWNFNKTDGTVIKNLIDGSKVHAHLMGFTNEHLAGIDIDPHSFSISQSIPEQSSYQVNIAKSGWSSFSGIKHNGLNPGVQTPVGKTALCLYSAKKGNWIHFPGLATALVDRPKGAARNFSIAAWFLLQTQGEKPQYICKNNPLMRFARTDMRVMTYQTLDRFYTEDVGNGLGGAKSYKTKWADREATAGKWFHLVITADQTTQKFRMFINNKEVEYAHKPNPTDGYAWPNKGGMQLNFETDADTDGLVIGRWLGGGAANNTTMGIASLVILKNEAMTEDQRTFLYELGKQGVPFDGNWP